MEGNISAEPAISLAGEFGRRVVCVGTKYGELLDKQIQRYQLNKNVKKLHLQR